MATTHALYVLAEQADARLTETLKSRTGRTRWTMKADDYKIPEVREALREKLNADEHWLMFLRHSRKCQVMDITRTCQECHEDWTSEGEYECPYCGFDNPQPEPLAPEGPSMIMLCGWCDGARERHAAAHAMGRVVTTGICPACEPKFLAEGRF